MHHNATTAAENVIRDLKAKAMIVHVGTYGKYDSLTYAEHRFGDVVYYSKDVPVSNQRPSAVTAKQSICKLMVWDFVITQVPTS